MRQQQAYAGPIAPGGFAHGADLVRGLAGFAFQRHGLFDALLGGQRFGARIKAAGQIVCSRGFGLAKPGVRIAEGGEFPGLLEQRLEIGTRQIRRGGDAGAAAADHAHAQPAALRGGQVFQRAVLNLGLAAAAHMEKGLRAIGAQGGRVADAILKARFQRFGNELGESLGISAQERASPRDASRAFNRCRRLSASKATSVTDSGRSCPDRKCRTSRSAMREARSAGNP